MHTTITTETMIGPDHVMDVREIPCAIKHGLILRACVELPVGAHFILQNGRDPVHLREEIAAGWPGAFAWEYLLQKEGEVRVKITRLKAVPEGAGLPPAHECSH